MRFYEINGDVKQSKIKKILIFIQIFFDVMKENRAKEDYKPKIQKEIILDLVGDKLYSPGRLGSLNYLVNFLNNNFKNDNLKVIDLGCGDGRYYKWIKRINNNKDFDYLGIDRKENTLWNKSQAKVKFLVKDIKSIEDLNLPIQPNLIFSQSVLEHAKNDKLLLSLISKKYPTVKQLHILPGSISGINYLAHGYRRYNLNELVQICKNLNLSYKIISFSGKRSLVDYFLWLKAENDISPSSKGHLFKNFFKSKEQYNPVANLEHYCGILKNEYPVQYALEIN